MGAALALIPKYIRTIEYTDIWQALPVQGFLLQHQRLLHQLLEKHVLVCASRPEDYGCIATLNHPIHAGDRVPISERYHNIPPVLNQEVKHATQWGCPEKLEPMDTLPFILL